MANSFLESEFDMTYLNSSIASSFVPLLPEESGVIRYNSVKDSFSSVNLPVPVVYDPINLDGVTPVVGSSPIGFYNSKEISINIFLNMLIQDEIRDDELLIWYTIINQILDGKRKLHPSGLITILPIQETPNLSTEETRLLNTILQAINYGFDPRLRSRMERIRFQRLQLNRIFSGERIWLSSNRVVDVIGPSAKLQVIIPRTCYTYWVRTKNLWKLLLNDRSSKLGQLLCFINSFNHSYINTEVGILNPGNVLATVPDEYIIPIDGHSLTYEDKRYVSSSGIEICRNVFYKVIADLVDVSSTEEVDVDSSNIV